MNLGFYLYGILPAPLSEKVVIEGLDRQPVQIYSVDGFNFLYSEAKKEKYLTSRRNLLCHEKVLELAMCEGFRTLLPLRFGLVVKTWETISDQLTRPYSEKLEELFKQLEGRREVSVKVFWNSQSEIQGLLESNVSLKTKRDAMEGKALSQSEIIEIGKLIENGLLFRSSAVIDVFRSELHPLAEDFVENETMTEEMIYNAAYLIPWDSESKFRERVEAIDQQFGDRLRIRYNNFTAPYTFAQLD